MGDPFQTLRQKVLKAVEDQRQKPEPIATRHPQVLAEYLRLQLAKVDVSETKLSEAAQLSERQVHMLLNGTLPLSILTEDVLERIASTVQCDTKLLQIILNRTDSKQTSAR